MYELVRVVCTVFFLMLLSLLSVCVSSLHLQRGLTALHYAALSGSAKCVALLVQWGLRTETQDSVRESVRTTEHTRTHARQPAVMLLLLLLYAAWAYS